MATAEGDDHDTASQHVCRWSGREEKTSCL
jgi:hypothetical protein